MSADDLEAIREALRVLILKLDRMIAEEKREKPSRGRIEFADGTGADLPDEKGTHNPRTPGEPSGRIIPPIPDLHDSGDQWGRHDDPEEN